MTYLSLLFLGLFSFSASALEVGETAPCVVLEHINADGSETSQCIREANEEGQLKVLEFFSAFCSACKRNLPLFSSLNKEFGEDVTFRLVGIDRNENALRRYRTSNKSLINFQVALDTDRDAKRAYDIIATPTLFVLDENDKVLYKHIGVLGQKDLDALRAIFKASINK